MGNKDFFSKVNHYRNKLSFIYDLKDSEELNISFDRLSTENKVEQELLYFVNDNESTKKEEKGLFVFGHNYFFKELHDQEFKRLLGQNMLNLLIIEAYNKIKKKDKAKISEVIEEIISSHSNLNFISRSKVLKRILMLAYYHNWDMEKSKDEIDSNYTISIPNNFYPKLKQRFDLKIRIIIRNDSKYKFFVNSKGDLCLVLKQLDIFTKSDIEEAIKVFQKDFKIKKINLLD